MSGYWIGKDEAILVRKKEFEQLTARVKGLEIDLAGEVYEKRHIADLQRIAALEQQLKYANEEKEYYKALGTNAEQIQQAEQRGYELARKIPNGFKTAGYAECGFSYEEACAERDDGEVI